MGRLCTGIAVGTNMGRVLFTVTAVQGRLCNVMDGDVDVTADDEDTDDDVGGNRRDVAGVEANRWSLKSGL